MEKGQYEPQKTFEISNFYSMFLVFFLFIIQVSQCFFFFQSLLLIFLKIFLGNIEFLIIGTYSFFEMSENFVLYITVLLGFAIKTNFINQERNTFDKNFSYLSIGSFAVFFIVSANIYINDLYTIHNFVTLILYFFLFLSKFSPRIIFIFISIIFLIQIMLFFLFSEQKQIFCLEIRKKNWKSQIYLKCEEINI